MKLDEIVGEEVELELDESWGWRGGAFARVDDGWVTVPAALPGEVVRVVVEDRIGYGRRSFAQLEQVIRASEERTAPGCPIVTTCRGCQVRHASLEAERDFKRGRLREIFARYAPDLDRGAIDYVGPEMSREAGYRWRSRLTFDPSKSPRLGLRAGPNRSLVSMSSCAALTAECRTLVERLEVAIDSEWSGKDAAEAARHCRGIDVWASSPNSIAFDGDTEALEPLLEPLRKSLPEVVISCGGSETSVELPYRACGLPLRASTGAWVHATAEPAEALYRFVRDWLAVSEGEHLDVGCGIGAISLLSVESGHTSVGIDRDPRAIESARANLRGHEERSRFVTADWEKGLRNLALESGKFDSATLNPMREPLGERALSFVNRLVTDQILILGPSPESAAKDAQLLTDLGWRASRAVAIDLHPASYQVMAGVEMTRDA